MNNEFEIGSWYYFGTEYFVASDYSPRPGINYECGIMCYASSKMNGVIYLKKIGGKTVVGDIIFDNHLYKSARVARENLGAKVCEITLNQIKKDYIFSLL